MDTEVRTVRTAVEQSDTGAEAGADVDPGIEHVVLIDGLGRPRDTIDKAGAHHDTTPVHLAFSSHLVRADGSVLLTRRAPTKATWPGTWTNGCCGHPQLGETLRSAVTRRIDEELGLRVVRAGIAVADFAYRATMADGTIEHELCPVLVVEVDGTVDPDPCEVDAFEWQSWEALVDRVATAPESLSPWCVEQVHRLSGLGSDPLGWLDGEPAGLLDVGLDDPIQLRAPVSPQHAAARPGGWSDATHLTDTDADTDSGRDGRGPGSDDPLLSVTRPLRRIVDRFLETKLDELRGIDPGAEAIASEIRSLVDAGGKRLRPAFVHWGHRATGAAHDDAVLRPAAAVELLHTFALLHDDVMDRSETRRGNPSAFVSLAAQHERSAGTGDPEWFGLSGAILAGDLAFVWADELLDSADVAVEVLDRARRVFTTLRTEVIAGQYLDLALAASPTADERDAERVALLKSARYTVTRPLLLGAALGSPPSTGVEERVADALTRYGDAVGLAFQMRDDVLGIFGDPSVTGKGGLDDLREGKRTVLYLRAMRLADPAGRAVLSASLGDPDVDERDAERCREVITSSGALASVEVLIADRHARAIAAIAHLDDPARSALEQLASSAIERGS
jgi:isopentenyl-diphosphate delta-isomerase type 1